MVADIRWFRSPTTIANH